VASLLLAKRLGYPTRQLLAYANSGDTAGEKSRVVGYAAIGMYASATASRQASLSQQAGQALVKAARFVLESHFKPAPGTPPVALADYPELTRATGLFVTLRTDGQLRGCIGRIESDTPLARLLPTVALDAALHDPRFNPLTADELKAITVEVSVLSAPTPIHSAQEIVAGRDGVVLSKNGASGVFLPQVWEETGWTRLEFLRELAHQKAGLSPDAWQDAQLFTFQDQTFTE
jgi:AmmeMemoRadiSam system protein A